MLQATDYLKTPVMMDQDSVTTALSQTHAKAAQGTCVDHEILKEAGRVSRYRQYRVYLPAGYDESKQYPLIMVLHGCRQDHLAIQSITGFDAIADRVGAIVVYPFVTTYAGLRTQNCWGWWLVRQRQRGRGEVSDLRRIAQDVSDTYSVDIKRRHICGLSSGGAMSVACMATYADFWTSGASVAGVPYGESINAVKANAHTVVRRKTLNNLLRLLRRVLVADAPSLLVVQSTGDSMVGPKLGANLRDSWAQASGCGVNASAVFSDSTRDVSWELEQYNDGDKLRVAHLLMEDLEHGWPGGLQGRFSHPEGPNISELIWRFFASGLPER